MVNAVAVKNSRLPPVSTTSGKARGLKTAGSGMNNGSGMNVRMKANQSSIPDID